MIPIMHHVGCPLSNLKSSVIWKVTINQETEQTKCMAKVLITVVLCVMTHCSLADGTDILQEHTPSTLEQ
jgi:hypothetical protein